MAFNFYCHNCGHKEYISGEMPRKCAECGWTPAVPEQGVGDGSETWHKFFNIIMTNRAITKNPEYYGHNENAANQILDMLDVIDSYSKECAKLEVENQALRAALQPFASVGQAILNGYLDSDPHWPNIDQLIAAAEALRKEEGF